MRGGKKGRNAQKILVILPKEDVRKMEEEVEQGNFVTKSDFIRLAIKQILYGEFKGTVKIDREDYKIPADLEKIKEISIPVLKNRGIKRASIFGSIARGDATKISDVDFLIDFKKERPTLFDVGGLKGDLERALNRSVDLVLFRSIDPRLKKRILKEKVDIL